MVEWRWSERAKGKPWSVADDAIVFTVRDGVIHRWREYIDRDSPTAADAPVE
jgi:ketosteroid isomerase-like protein